MECPSEDKRGRQRAEGSAARQSALPGDRHPRVLWRKQTWVQVSRARGPAKETALGLCRVGRWKGRHTRGPKADVSGVTLGPLLCTSGDGKHCLSLCGLLRGQTRCWVWKDFISSEVPHRARWHRPCAERARRSQPPGAEGPVVCDAGEHITNYKRKPPRRKSEIKFSF